MANRRSGISPGRRSALALAMALALLCSAGAASADDGTRAIITATVYGPGGGTTQDSVSLATLQSDPQRCPAYSKTSMEEYNNSGPPVPVGLQAGETWSLATALKCMQNPISVNDVQGITLVNTDGSPQVGANSQLTERDLQSPSDFSDTSDSPVVSNLGSTLQYNRPWRGAGDANLPDQVNSDDAIAVEVFEGPHITVSASASASTVSAGTNVTFSSTVSGNHGTPTYDWRLGDNLPDSALANPTVAFPDAGDYIVTLQVSDAAGGGGGTSVPITVTSSTATTPAITTGPATTTGPISGTGTTPGGGSTGGPKGGGEPPGHTPTSQTGTTSQTETTSTGPTTPVPIPTQTKQPRSRSTTPSSATRHPNSSGTSTASGSGGTTSGAAGLPPATTAPATPSAHPSATRHAPTHRPSSPSSPASGRVVTGLLISDVTPLPAGASPLVSETGPTAAAAPGQRRHGAPSPIPLIASLAAVVLLLGLGARRELHVPRLSN